MTQHSSPVTADLLPCPFCGSSDVSEERGRDNWPVAMCNDCGAMGPCIELDCRAANDLWNARAAHAQRQQDARPIVGWRYAHKGQGDWHVLAKDPREWLIGFSPIEYDVEPLYAAPAQCAPVLDALQTARQAIEYSLDMGGTDPAGVLLQALNKCDRALSPVTSTVQTPVENKQGGAS